MHCNTTHKAALVFRKLFIFDKEFLWITLKKLIWKINGNYRDY